MESVPVLLMGLSSEQKEGMFQHHLLVSWQSSQMQMPEEFKIVSPGLGALPQEQALTMGSMGQSFLNAHMPECMFSRTGISWVHE